MPKYSNLVSKIILLLLKIKKIASLKKLKWGERQNGFEKKTVPFTSY